jgi:hypothetical protein
MYRTLIGKLEGKRLIEIPRSRREDKVGIYLKVIGMSLWTEYSVL